MGAQKVHQCIRFFGRCGVHDEPMKSPSSSKGHKLDRKVCTVFNSGRKVATLYNRGLYWCSACNPKCSQLVSLLNKTPSQLRPLQVEKVTSKMCSHLGARLLFLITRMLWGVRSYHHFKFNHRFIRNTKIVTGKIALQMSIKHASYITSCTICSLPMSMQAPMTLHCF